jgi:hypothetical protein
MIVSTDLPQKWGMLVTPCGSATVLLLLLLDVVLHEHLEFAWARELPWEP